MGYDTWLCWVRAASGPCLENNLFPQTGFRLGFCHYREMGPNLRLGGWVFGVS